MAECGRKKKKYRKLSSLFFLPCFLSFFLFSFFLSLLLLFSLPIEQKRSKSFNFNQSSKKNRLSLDDFFFGENIDSKMSCLWKKKKHFLFSEPWARKKPETAICSVSCPYFLSSFFLSFSLLLSPFFCYYTVVAIIPRLKFFFLSFSVTIAPLPVTLKTS